VNALRVLIVDDEAPARAKLRRYLEADSRVEVAGESANGEDAVRDIEALAPDAVLLDVRMPVLDGFEVLEALDVEIMPYIIFVTAHDEHAVRAFDVRALDYLLKPVDRERLAAAIDRAIALGPASQKLPLEPEAGEASKEPLRRFLVRERGRLLLVSTSDVDWIGAAGNYVELHVGKAVHLVRGSLTELENRLPSDRFVRVHRSSIVNLDQVKELRPWSHGDLMIVLTDGTELRLSRRYRDRLGGIFSG